MPLISRSMATKSDDRTWRRSSASDGSKFAVVTVFKGNAESHCVGVVGVAGDRARASTRESDGEGSLYGFIVCAAFFGSEV